MTYCGSIGLTIMSATPKSELKQQLFLEPMIEKGHVTGMLLTRVKEKLSTRAQRMRHGEDLLPCFGNLRTGVRHIPRLPDGRLGEAVCGQDQERYARDPRHSKQRDSDNHTGISNLPIVGLC